MWLFIHAGIVSNRDLQESYHHLTRLYPMGALATLMTLFSENPIFRQPSLQTHCVKRVSLNLRYFLWLWGFLCWACKEPVDQPVDYDCNMLIKLWFPLTAILALCEGNPTVSVTSTNRDEVTIFLTRPVYVDRQWQMLMTWTCTCNEDYHWILLCKLW